MKRIVFILLLLFTGINLQAQSGIRKLEDSAAFEAAIANNEKAVVIFAAEWCEYCKAFLPKVEAIMADYKDVKFFKINYDENIALFQAEGIQATPTVKLYKNGKKTDEMIVVETPPLVQKIRNF
ncbi:MAG: thioredoxin family protein [Sinomicrobium sp.]|nr:thioredoxin family protein [Sinomicrobium sp.]